MPRRRFYRRRRPRRWKKYRPRRKPRQRNVCSYCGRKFRTLLYRCNYCGEFFCPDHHIPESHKCIGLPPRSWDVYQAERAKREPRVPVREPLIWVPSPKSPRVVGAIRGVRRRDGTIVDFDEEKITSAIFRTVRDQRTAEELSDKVMRTLEQKYARKIPTLKDIHNVVKKVLIDYRKQQKIPKPFRFPRIRLPGFVKIPLLILLILALEFFVIKSLFNPTVYILAAIAAAFLNWKIFQRVSRISVHSDARIFGLRILSVLFLLSGIFLGAYWFLTVTNSFLFFGYPPDFVDKLHSLGEPLFSSIDIFVLVFAFGLVLIALFLNFKFMRRAGIIIFPR